MSARRLAIVLVLASACEQGVEVTVRPRPALLAPTSLRVTVADGDDLRVQDLAIPAGARLPLSFVIDTSGRDGEARVQVEGLGPGPDPILLGLGTGAVPLGVDATATITLEPADRVATRSRVAGDQVLVDDDRAFGGRQLVVAGERLVLGFDSDRALWTRWFDRDGRPARNQTHTDQEYPMCDPGDAGTVALAANPITVAMVWPAPDRRLRLNAYDATTGALVSFEGGAVVSDPLTYPRLPALAGLADGRFAVAWLASGAGVGYEGDLRLQVVEPRVFEKRRVIALGRATTAPALAALPDGGHVVVWSAPGPGGAASLRAQIHDELTPRDAIIELTEALELRTRSQLYPQVAALPDGGFVVAWLDGRSGATTVRARWVDADGAPRGPAIDVAEVGAFNQTPAVIVSARLGVVIAWSDGPDIDRDVWYRRFGLDGSPREPARPLATTTAGNQRQPSLAPLPDGFAAAWTDESASGDDPSGAAVRSRIVYLDPP